MRQQPYAGRVINETTAVRGEELGVTGVGIKVLGYQWDNSRTRGGITGEVFVPDFARDFTLGLLLLDIITS